MANIISGSLKGDFTDSDLACIMSTPSVTRGSDINIEPSKTGDVQKWIFRHKKHEIVVEISSLKEDIGAKAEIAGMAQLDSVEILAKINSVDIPTTVINRVIDVFYTMLSMEIQNIPEIPPDFRVEALNIIKTQRFLFACGESIIIVDAGIKRDSTEESPTAQDGKPERDETPEEEDNDELRNLRLIMEIPIELTVEMGRTQKRINDLLKLG